MRSMLRIFPLVVLSMSVVACANKDKDSAMAPCESGYALQGKRCVLESVINYNQCIAQKGVSQDSSDQIAGRLDLHFYGPNLGLRPETRQRAKTFATLYPDQCSNLQGVWSCYQQATRSADPSAEPLCQ